MTVTKGDTFDPAQIQWVWDKAQLKELLKAMRAAEEITADLESTGLNEYHRRAKVTFAAITLPTSDGVTGATWAVPLYHPESPWIGKWRKVLTYLAKAMRGRYLIGANFKFDMRWIQQHTGVDLAPWLGWDTQISSHLLDENASTKLKERAPDTFGIERWDDFDLSYDEASLDVPLIELGLYACRDTYWTWRLAENHRDRMFVQSDDHPEGGEEVEEARLGKLAQWVAMPTVQTLTRIEVRGMGMDIDWVRAKVLEDEAIRDENQEWLAGRYGLNPAEASFAPTSGWFARWTQEAMDAGDLRLAGMTKGGKPQWSKGILRKQARDGSEVAERLLYHRDATKQLEFLRSWLELVRADGALHPSYHAGRVVTGRLSSSGPNAQQITKALKPAFVPRPGYVIADCDFSQIELRVAAVLARCQPMIEAFQRGEDLHRLIAAQITGKSVVDVLPDERQKGKAANFGYLYGQQAYGFRMYAEDVYGVRMTAEEAQRAYEAYFETWAGLQEWHTKAVADTYRDGQITSKIGRVRRLPQIYSGDPERSRGAEKQAINSPVQGFASDLMQLAAASIEGMLPGYDPVPDVRLIGTVHDSIVAEVPEGPWKEVTRQCLARMESVTEVLADRLECEFDVPLKADATVGTRWGWSDVGEL